MISLGPSRVLTPVATAPNRLAAAYPTAKSIDDPSMIATTSPLPTPRAVSVGGERVGARAPTRE